MIDSRIIKITDKKKGTFRVVDLWTFERLVERGYVNRKGRVIRRKKFILSCKK